MAFVLCVTLSALFIIALVCNDFEIQSPGVLFTLGFALVSIAAFVFGEMWDFDPDVDTVLVLVLGVGVFVLITLLIRSANERMHLRWSIKDCTYKRIEVRTSAMVVLIALQVLVFVWSLWKIQVLVPADSIADSVRLFKQSNTFSIAMLDFGTPLRQLRAFAIASGFFVAFLVGQDIAFGLRRKSLLLICSLVVAIAIGLEAGGRSGAVHLVVAVVLSVMIVRRLAGKKYVRNKVRFYLMICVALVVFLATFRISAIGRNDGINSLDYLTMYLGAQIPNLDIYLHSIDDFNMDGAGFETLRSLANYIGSKFGMLELMRAANLPFQRLNGHELGNVYTAFYAFLVDGGIVGVVGFTTLMAALSQFVYSRVMYANCSRYTDIWICIYLYMAFGVLMSFFGNTFYSNMFNIAFLHNIIYLAILHVVVVKNRNEKLVL